MVVINYKTCRPLTHYSYYQLNQLVYKKTNDKKMIKMLEDIDKKIITLKEPEDTLINYSHIETLNKCDYYLRYNRYNISHKHILNTIIPILKEKEMLPAICFVFSRKR